MLRLVASMPVKTGEGFREPATGEVLKVEVVRAYDSASGRPCREYAVTDQRGVQKQGVACRAGDQWVSARPLRPEKSARDSGRLP